MLKIYGFNLACGEIDQQVDFGEWTVVWYLMYFNLTHFRQQQSFHDPESESTLARMRIYLTDGVERYMRPPNTRMPCKTVAKRTVGILLHSKSASDSETITGYVHLMKTDNSESY